MEKIALIIIFLNSLCNSSIFAQNIPRSPNLTDENSLKQGTWTILYDANWKVIDDESKAEFYRIITYKDNKPIGKVTDWYKNGQTQMVADSLIQEEPDKFEGIVTFYRRGGSKEKMLIYESNQVVQETLYDTKGEIVEENWESLNQKGKKAYYDGDYKKATQFFEKAKTQAEKDFKKTHLSYIESLNNLALLYRLQELYKKAEELYLEALETYKEILGKKHPFYANSLNNLALLYQAQDLYKKAEPLYLEALQIRKEVLGKKHQAYAISLNSLAIFYDNQGLYRKAEVFHLEALQIREETIGKMHPDYANSLNNLAASYVMQGLYKKAEGLYLEALDIKKEVLGKKHPILATSLNNLALLYQKQGLYEKAEPLYLEALQIRKEVLGKKHSSYASSLDNLAGLYYKQGLYTKAEPLFQEAKNIREETLGKKHQVYAVSLNNLAFTYNKLDLYSKSEPLYLEALQIYKEVLGEKHPYYVNSLKNLADVYQKQKLYAKAEPLYLQVLQTQEEILGTKHPYYASSLNYLAILYQAQSLYSQSEPLYKEAIQNKLGQIETLLPTFSEFDRKQYLQSIENYFSSFYAFASEYYLEKTSIASDVFDLRLKMKGLLFQSFQKIQEEILNSGDATLIAKFGDWKDKRNQLAKFYELSQEEKEKSEIDEATLRAEADALEKELSQVVGNITGFQNQERLTWQTVQAQLQSNEALVEMIRIVREEDTVYMALIITSETQNQPKMVLLENGAELETQYINNYHNAIHSQIEDKFSYPQYWQAIQDILPSSLEKLYFSPDGIYHQINLQTLKNPESDSYLLEEFDIQILGTPKDLISYAGDTDVQQKQLEDYELYLFGYPLYNSFGSSNADERSTEDNDRALSLLTSEKEGLRFFSGGTVSLLPGTKTEIENIQKIAQKKKISTSVFLEEKATEENLKSIQNPDILHIATHGFFLANLPKAGTGQRGLSDLDSKRYRENPLLRSGLLFSGAESSLNQVLNPGRTENGILTADEALTLNLNQTDLVVLSACETGLGEIANGEGVYGLQRAFQQAGAKTVLMSLWKVSDEATQKMMTYFYENLINKKQDKRTAFQNAQNQLKKDYPAPYYWGAFVMVGE